MAAYAKAIGEQPRIVVARAWLGLDGLFTRPTVVVADEQTSVAPNPVLDQAGRHRLAVASPVQSRDPRQPCPARYTLACTPAATRAAAICRFRLSRSFFM
ncbi:hypothetical protein ACNUDN_29175 [Mycobacterium sp. smrl_JER01]|uniref:hypothetical protein n=1 Tax=Mycobacterium sp. smrl_JER01 TaxID=3402633 RepID=UPI003ACE3873